MRNFAHREHTHKCTSALTHVSIFFRVHRPRAHPKRACVITQGRAHILENCATTIRVINVCSTGARVVVEQARRSLVFKAARPSDRTRIEPAHILDMYPQAGKVWVSDGRGWCGSRKSSWRYRIGGPASLGSCCPTGRPRTDLRITTEERLTAAVAGNPNRQHTKPGPD